MPAKKSTGSKKAKKDAKPSTEADQPGPAPEEKEGSGSSKADKERVEAGDIITLDLDAWILHPDGNEELFDTTNEEHAKAGDILDEKAEYRPIVTIVGDGRVLPGLEKSFLDAVVGDKTVVNIPPEEGAGERKPNMVEIFSLREMQRQDITPEPGMRVQIKNRMGTITNVTSGRVRVDFNDPLAGKTLKYEYTVLRKAGTPEERALGILEADYGRSEEFAVIIAGEAADIVLADICKYDQAWFTLKYKVVSDLRQHLGLKTIRFIEEYVKRDEPAPEEEPAEEPGPAPEELVPEVRSDDGGTLEDS